MSRDYWGHHYDGQFVGLDASTPTHGMLEQAYRNADEDRRARDENASLMERFTRRVYEAFEHEYFAHPEQRTSITPHLRYWACRLRHFCGRDWEETSWR